MVQFDQNESFHSVEGPIDEIEPAQTAWPNRLSHPLILASPHSGRAYPTHFLAQSRLNHTTLRRSEDFCVDQLYNFAEELNTPLIAAQFPRSFVDVNRSASEIDPVMLFPEDNYNVAPLSKRVSNGLGVVPRVVGAGIEIYNDPIGFTQITERLSRFHVPYHALLKEKLQVIHAQFGCAVLLDCHSMPDTVSTRRLMHGKSCDMVLGDCYGASCHRSVVDAAEACLSDLGYRVVRNDPYAGGYTTSLYGKPNFGFHSLQIEINRRLYMDERRLILTPGYQTLKRNLRVLVEDMIQASSAFASRSQPPVAAE